MAVQAFEVAPMTLHDLDQVMEIERLSFCVPWSVDSFRTEICFNRYAWYIIGRLPAQKVIGYAGIWMVGTEGHITTLAVHPSCRRMGVGSLLLENLLQQAKVRAVKKIFLEVRDSNREARNLYEKYEFNYCGRKKKYYYDEDAVLMVKGF